MSIWNTQATESYESENSDTPFKSGSQFLVIAEKVEWKEVDAEYVADSGQKIVNVQFRVSGTYYNNLVFFKKIKVMSPKEKAAEGAVKFLSALDGATGAGFMGLGREPTDQELSKACNVPLIIKLAVFANKSNGERINYVNGISKYNGTEPQKPEREAPRPVSAAPAGGMFSPQAAPSPFAAPAKPPANLDDDIPF